MKDYGPPLTYRLPKNRCKSEGKPAGDLPNTVILLADDLGYSDIGTYGGEIATPYLDHLAENEIRFTQMHNTSKCFPSRAALLTGLYARQVGMHQSPGDFHHGVMFGEVLKTAGYRTLFVGKHHGTDNPYDWGFDHYFGRCDGGGSYFNPGLYDMTADRSESQDVSGEKREIVEDLKEQWQNWAEQVGIRE